MRPRFSIVIPTRNRPATLRWSLRTCVEQDHEDVEIIVCDNCSVPETREVVEEVGRGRVRYVRSDVPLAMTANWEFAMSHVSGEYVMILGDDDGLMSQALTQVDEMLRELDVKVLTSKSVVYIWPGFGANFIDDNVLRIPSICGSSVRQGSNALGNVVMNLSTVRSLPSPYNGFVHREVIERIRGKNGRIFNCAIPDWFSAFAITASVETYGESGVPFHIIGGSASSTGKDFIQGQTTPIQEEFARLNSVVGLNWSGQTPVVQMSTSAIAAECIQQVLVHVRPEDPRLRIEPKDLVRAVIRELRAHTWAVSPEAWQKYVGELEKYTEHQGLSAWFEDTYPDLDSACPPTWSPPSKSPLGLLPEGLSLDASHFGVTNVFEAAELCDRILLRKRDAERAVNWRTPAAPSPWSEWMAETTNLLRGAAPISVVRVARELHRRTGEVRRKKRS